MDEIIIQENNIVSAEAEAQESIHSEIYGNYLHHIDNTSLDVKKEKE